jgi:hypothetical protein
MGSRANVAVYQWGQSERVRELLLEPANRRGVLRSTPILLYSTDAIHPSRFRLMSASVTTSASEIVRLEANDSSPGNSWQARQADVPGVPGPSRADRENRSAVSASDEFDGGPATTKQTPLFA